jgi:hypothetical protein
MAAQATHSAVQKAVHFGERLFSCAALLHANKESTLAGA